MIDGTLHLVCVMRPCFQTPPKSTLVRFS